MSQNHFGIGNVKCMTVNFSDGTRESSIVTKMFLVEETADHRRSEDEMSDELRRKHEVISSELMHLFCISNFSNLTPSSLPPRATTKVH